MIDTREQFAPTVTTDINPALSPLENATIESVTSAAERFNQIALQLAVLAMGWKDQEASKQFLATTAQNVAVNNAVAEGYVSNRVGEYRDLERLLHMDESGDEDDDEDDGEEDYPRVR